ncbi:MAG: SDR family NAD(P)-dependent oxidoreductase, partial [Clostridia bacterium]|nr:SDR family NAD(P)-dependent oxidoreductase [Clostridia bacterium]
MKILFTGGLGYIGSHTAVEFLNYGYDVVIADNLSNSKENVTYKIEKITGKKVKFYNVDVCDENKLEKIFIENSDIFAVIHFAGYKAVGESVREPLKYYENNMVSTFNLLKL